MQPPAGQSIYSNEAYYYGFYVSLDSKKSLIFADFFEEELNYTVVYKKLEELRSQTEDSNTTISIVGHPMHLGVVASMIRMVNLIMLGTAIVIPILLFLAYRSIWATIMVPMAGVVSGIWGLGFMGFMGFMGIMRYNLDPLIFVMPFLISLMAFRHSHQLYKRSYEEYAKTLDNLAGIRVIIKNMFTAAVTSIMTDAFGIAIVALAPIPVLPNMAIAGDFWSIITVVVGLILTPVVLSYVPTSAKFLAHMAKERIIEERREGFANHFADWLGPWLISRRGLYTVSMVILVISIPTGTTGGEGYGRLWKVLDQHGIVSKTYGGAQFGHFNSNQMIDVQRIHSIVAVAQMEFGVNFERDIFTFKYLQEYGC